LLINFEQTVLPFCAIGNSSITYDGQEVADLVECNGLESDSRNFFA